MGLYYEFPVKKYMAHFISDDSLAVSEVRIILFARNDEQAERLATKMAKGIDDDLKLDSIYGM